ncbi:MAG: rhodanese-like domain-containing protein [Verrucomicrobiota bacterium]
MKDLFQNLATVGVFLSTALAHAESPSPAPLSEWTTFLTAEQVAQKTSDPRTILVDVRQAEAYLAGHLPGAINLPGSFWRTPKASPGEGDSQYLFRREDGTADVARYERFLGEAGIAHDSPVIIYGNHAGKTDGTIPAMILDWLGHESVYFLDGLGAEEWTAAGFALSQSPSVREATTYHATPKADFVWNLDQVLAHLRDPDVLFIDTRSLAEYTGDEKRSNAHGGHIPGAIRLDYLDHLEEDSKRVLPPAQILASLEERNIDRQKTLVLYCQTSTRVSLLALALGDLGFPKVAVYDASWHEYGNRSDTPIAR